MPEGGLRITTFMTRWLVAQKNVQWISSLKLWVLSSHSWLPIGGWLLHPVHLAPAWWAGFSRGASQGSQISSYWLGSNVSSPQLPLWALSLFSLVQAVCLFSIKTNRPFSHHEAPSSMKWFWPKGFVGETIRGQGGSRNPHGGGGFRDELQRIVRIFTGRHGMEKKEASAGRR